MNSVDVVVPCYNYGRFLRRCVGSVLDQPGVAVRVLIIDDCSKDDSATVASDLARHDPRVTVIRHAVNRGHIATYNEGLLDWAAADFSILLSADDFLMPGALRKAAAIMRREPDVSLVYGKALEVRDDEPTPEFAADGDDLYSVIDSFRFLRRTFIHGNPVPTPAAVVRTSIQKKVGGYDRALPHTGDMEMWMRFAISGPVAVTHAPLAYYRKHGEAMSVAYYAGIASDRRERIAACHKICTLAAGKFPELANEFEEARKQLAREVLEIAAAQFESGAVEVANECMAVAAELYTGPKLREWRKLRIKLSLGYPAWRLLRGPLRLLSGGSPPHGHAAGLPRERNRLIGWIPDPVEPARRIDAPGVLS